MEVDLAANFIFDFQNYYELLIDEGHVPTAHVAVEKCMSYLTNKHELLPSSALFHLFIASCDTCLRVTHLYDPALGLVTGLHIQVAA